LLAAGITDVWADPETGEQVQTFSILTTEANALMAEIHNVKKRMPVFLQGASDTQLWLQGHPEDRSALLKPASDSWLKAHRVADFVSRAGEDRNRVECQKAFDEPRQASLF
jgi:putative SOS response-associated peptidase YedK